MKVQVAAIPVDNIDFEVLESYKDASDGHTRVHLLRTFNSEADAKGFASIARADLIDSPNRAKRNRKLIVQHVATETKPARTVLRHISFLLDAAVD